jgi:integrase
VRAVRRPGDRRGGLPGHHYLAHAADRQRRADRRRGRPGAGMISALVAAGITGGYLASARLAQVHWQAAGRALAAPRISTAGESVLWVDPAEIPAAADIEALGRALAAGRHGDRDELMAHVAAYTGLRWGELTALTIGQVDTGARVIAVDRKVIEVAGHLYVEPPKNRSGGGPSTPAPPRPATRSPSGSRPASRRPAPSTTPGPTRSG